MISFQLLLICLGMSVIGLAGSGADAAESAQGTPYAKVAKAAIAKIMGKNPSIIEPVLRNLSGCCLTAP